MKKISKLITTITLTLCLSNLFFLHSAYPDTINNNTISYDSEISLCNDELIAPQN